MYLLDVNVLVALAWPNHVFHDRAHRWFQTAQKRGWATCSLTQSGFVRVSSNRSALPLATSPASAIDLLRQITRLPNHTFWTDDFAIAESEHVAPDRLHGHGQITDAHLLGLALGRGEKLATMDARLIEILPALADKSAVLVIPS